MSQPNARPRLLLLAPLTSYRIAAYRQAAAALGIDLVVGSDVPSAFANDNTVAVDFASGTTDDVGCIDGVVAVDEMSAMVAAQIAEAHALPFHSAAGVFATGHKLRMRQLLAAHQVPVPMFAALDDDSSAVGFPCVVKPPMLAGSQGVIRADDSTQLARAAERIRHLLTHHPSALRARGEFHQLLVERYVPGAEVAVEALMHRGQPQLLAIFDKPDPLTGPFFVETLYVSPSRLPDTTQADLLDVTWRACRALGFDHGPVHAELRLGPQGPVIIEVAARSIGGLCSSGLTPLLGSLEQRIIRNALGHAPLALVTDAPAVGMMMVPVPKSGVLAQVSGEAAARQVAGIRSLHIAARPGDTVRALPDGASYLGFIFAAADTPRQVEQALRNAHDELTFRLKRLLT